jgi:hypothetical protein
MNDGEIILYRTDDGKDAVQLRIEGETVWLSLNQIAALFERDKSVISRHLKTIFDDGELDRRSVVAEFATTAADGKTYQVEHYNLDMILAVGYRVRSPRGVQFRRWATTTLREYLVKGFVMNDERLKDPAFDYFDELLERIRDIRASEKRFYQKVRDLFAETSADYDGSSATARRFFQTIQNKMLYAVTGHTAAELIVARADPDQPNMGLTTWSGKRVRKQDVVTAKNYLNEDEVSELNRLVTMFLDFAEDRAKRRQQITMNEWVTQTDRFLDFNERQVLTGAGKVTHAGMKQIAHDRFETFDAARRQAETEAAEREHIEELGKIEKDVRKLGKREKR